MSDSTLWSRVAGSYDQEAGHGIRVPAEAERWWRLFSRLFPADRPQRILDVGTGTGFAALILDELGHQVTGVDFSDQMLAVARAKADAQGRTVRFLLADATSPQLAGVPGLHVPAGGFDAVVSRHVIWALPDPVATIGTWAALTRPGGRVVAIDGVWNGARPADVLAELAGAWLAAARTRRRPHRPTGDPDLPLRRIRDAAPAGEVFTRAGLVQVGTERLPEIDQAERAGMSLTERLQSRWRRYLVAGTVPPGS